MNVEFRMQNVEFNSPSGEAGGKIQSQSQPSCLSSHLASEQKYLIIRGRREKKD